MSSTPCTCDTSSCVDARCLVFVLCTVAFEDVIPADAPPSYRGQAIKYSYKLIIGAQMLEHPTKLLRIPFRVLVLHGRLPHYKPNFRFKYKGHLAHKKCIQCKHVIKLDAQTTYLSGGVGHLRVVTYYLSK